ncbi:unnamed protein product [Caenorhabditis sp. 36 PRJEB53466]|nr:unnamed protein product [Caenorhabditis sp. 36 PRJEB53466]
MSTFAETTGKTAEEQDINKFFENAEKEETAQPPSLALRASYCASWVNDCSFEIHRGNSPEPSIIQFDVSPLPESVGSVRDLKKKLEENKKESQLFSKRKAVVEPKNTEKRPKLAPTIVATIKTLNFFETVARAKAEIEKWKNAPAGTGGSKWKVVKGIYVEMESDEDTTNTSGPKTEFDELMQLFGRNTKIFGSVSFEHSYSFDWDHFSRRSMQYVVFTKVCQSHPPGHFMELRKEDTKCSDCGGSDLSMTVRLAIPLLLSEIPIPMHENLGIYVAFLAKKLPEFRHLTESTGIFDFSRETAEKMYQLYQGVLCGKPSAEYQEWFERCRIFAKRSLFSKRVHLLHGRIVRRKFEEHGNFRKRRCFVFADIFDFE